jgi:HK97 family phage prohead protease|nr:MAG TPA: major capsid protein [Caudoviricetes sp.]
MKVDFSGYATKSGVLCSDGRIIGQGAFAHQDNHKVPLLYGHDHKDPTNIVGHALLHSRNDGMYAECSLNDTMAAQNLGKQVKHGDLNSLSIFANDLRHDGTTVTFGNIREVSLVLAGANREAKIDAVYITHGDGFSDEVEDAAIIQFGELLTHGEAEDSSDSDDDDETIQDIVDSMTEKQQNAVAYLVTQALEDSGPAEKKSEESSDKAEHSADKPQEGSTLTHNIFQGGATQAPSQTLTHDQFMTVMKSAQDRHIKLSESFLAHANDYGIKDINTLFPDAKTLWNTPEFISRRMEWVAGVLNGTRHAPFTKIKTILADITADNARAKGYKTGTKKKDEVFTLLHRITHPQTIYKKQKLDRDDILDITDFDVVAWIKGEMRLMLDEEIARAILVGDGRQVTDDDKIKEENIRPIWKDDELYSYKVQVDKDAKPDACVEAMIRGLDDYRGSGNPTMYAPSKFVTDLLLQKDQIGRRLYETEAALASAIGVSKIVRVPVMEKLEREVDTKKYDLKAIVVNLQDYTTGTNKGGQISFFDDFDLDFNQEKYLLETRMSGALVRPGSAMVLEMAQA